MTNHDDSIVSVKRKLESTNQPMQTKKQEKPNSNSANVLTEEFNYEQYHQEQIQRMRKILQDMAQELPTQTQTTGEIDEIFGIPKSEAVLIEKIVERHKLKTTLK